MIMVTLLVMPCDDIYHVVTLGHTERLAADFGPLLGVWCLANQRRLATEYLTLSERESQLEATSLTILCSSLSLGRLVSRLQLMLTV